MSIVLNEQFTKNTVIGKVGENELTLPYSGKATFLLNFHEQKPERLSTGTVALRINEQVWQFCFDTIDPEQLPRAKTYLFQFDNY